MGKGASLFLVVTVASAHDSDVVLSSYFFLRLPQAQKKGLPFTVQ